MFPAVSSTACELIAELHRNLRLQPLQVTTLSRISKTTQSIDGEVSEERQKTHML